MRPSFLTGAFILAALPALGQDAQPTLEVELNRTEDVEQGNCVMTYVVANRTDRTVGRAAYEIGIFDAAGQVMQLMALDFGEFPRGKTKIARFGIPQTPCADISRILVNAAVACEVDGEQDSDLCLSALATRSLTDIQFGL